jgi:L-serine dehydratase
MKHISIFNDVLGPVMRGPSSSHTAAPYHIGQLARSLLGAPPASATFTFDPVGSFSQVYAQQGSDLGFVAGLMGWPLTGQEFHQALALARAEGVEIDFATRPIPEANHPNTVRIDLVGSGGQQLRLAANSTGGGAIVLFRLQDWPVHITGDSHELFVALAPDAQQQVLDTLPDDGQTVAINPVQQDGQGLLLHLQRQDAVPASALDRIRALPGVEALWTAEPVFFVQKGQPLFGSAAEMVTLAGSRNRSLGQIALAYEAQLLGLGEETILAEVLRRYKVMKTAVHQGLGPDLPPMQLLQPSARQIYQAEAGGRLPTGGLHTRAAARAMAVMHVNGGMGVVCAAPTAGSAGTIPGVLVTLAEDQGLNEQQTAMALLAASAVGLVTAARATFAAEVAGCQVEIGAAGAMAAAAVVEAAGGTAQQATDAAAIAYQNTMGSVCDLVQGIVEIPCHTRNAVAASSAFVCADLVLGGYANPVGLDETIDAVYSVGKMLPRELKVTALGGLALAPSAQALPNLRQPQPKGGN